MDNLRKITQRLIKQAAADFQSGEPEKVRIAENYFKSPLYEHHMQILGLPPLSLPKGVSIPKHELIQPPEKRADEIQVAHQKPIPKPTSGLRKWLRKIRRLNDKE